MTERFKKILMQEELVSWISIAILIILAFSFVHPFPETLVVTSTTTQTVYPSVYTSNNTYNSHPIDSHGGGGTFGVQMPSFDNLCIDNVPQLELSYSNLVPGTTIIFYFGIFANVESSTPAIAAFNISNRSETNLAISLKNIHAKITVGTMLTLSDWYGNTLFHVQQITVTSCGSTNDRKS